LPTAKILKNPTLEQSQNSRSHF
jgi:hypothetical protein